MKKPPARRATFAAPLDVLADRGREALDHGRFKEAMEVFKQLARLDPRPEWTRRLADAYAGRAHALADKGMFKEAALVLENTLSAGQTIREPLLYLTCLVRQGQHQKAKQAALNYADQLPAAEAGYAAIHRPTLPRRRSMQRRATSGNGRAESARLLTCFT